MQEPVEFALRAAGIGLAATALGDLWSLLARRTMNVRSPDWALVGRWFGHLAKGTLVHDNIAKSPPVAGERALGWLGHYAIGVGFATLLLALWGLEWARSPTLAPALIIGWATLAAPFFVMQPAMGSGFAASRAPDPAAARRRSLVTHSVFGLSLYIAAVAAVQIAV